MAFWDVFKQERNTMDKQTELEKQIAEFFPGEDENQKVKVACLAGLCAKVAFSDMDIQNGEVDSATKALNQWCELSPELSANIAKIAMDNAKELAGQEDHKYTHQINDLTSKEERYRILEALFHIAAADGSVEGMEVEEIRSISNGLLLDRKHFLAAKATVVKHLKALRRL